MAIWEGLGASPQPSVFVAGTNETHTATPQTISINGMIGLDAAAAALQTTALQPTFGAFQFSPSGPYGTAPGSPAVVSPTQLARYLPQGGLQIETDLANRLAFTAHAFRLGLLGTVIMERRDLRRWRACSSCAPAARARRRLRGWAPSPWGAECAWRPRRQAHAMHRG